MFHVGFVVWANAPLIGARSIKIKNATKATGIFFIFLSEGLFAVFAFNFIATSLFLHGKRFNPKQHKSEWVFGLAQKQSVKKRLALWAVLVIAILAVASVYVVWQAQPSTSVADKKTLYQVSAFNTFSAGAFAGYVSYGELAKHGDFGIGTFDGLNGEMLALDGKFYQIAVDGKPKQVDSSYMAPYATVTYFEADKTSQVNLLNYTQLLAYINGTLPDQNSIYAIKVTGTFSYAQTRSVPAQTAPYPPLLEAIKNQTTFTLTNVSATAVGFWFPKSMDSVDVVGFHLHLITSDHQAGGHLLDCILKNVSVEIDQIKNYQLKLSP
jgi:acetolactate decarboxylase